MAEAKKEEAKKNDPLNIRINQARNSMRQCMDQIALSCQIPGPVMELILEGLILELKNTNLNATVMQYDEAIIAKDMEIKALKEASGKEASKDGK